MGFLKQEYWSGLPFPSPGDLPDPGIEPGLLCLLHWQTGSLPLSSWKASKDLFHSLILTQRIDTVKLWCWGRILRVSWTARRLNESILKEINTEYLLEGLMLKLQFFGHLVRRASSLEKTLILGKIKGKRSRGWQRMRWLNTSPT